MTQQVEKKTAEHCPVSDETKKKPKRGLLFWLKVAHALMAAFNLVDKYLPKLLKFFEDMNN